MDQHHVKMWSPHHSRTPIAWISLTTYLLYVSLASRVGPNICRLMFMRSVVSICIASCVLYSPGSGVKIVHVVLSELRMRLLVCVHVCISCRYAFVRFMSVCVDVMVMS